MKAEFDLTKVVEEISMQAKENQEEFIFETIRPYCENILQIKINKEELKQILLNGMRKQQPCDDCISREAIRKLICQNNDKYGYSDRFHEFTERCLQLPSVTPSHEDLKEAYIKGYDYGVKDWFKSKSQPCEDAISREDAIREIQDKYGDNAVGIDIVDIVAHLPSVRPCREIVEDKRACERCIHYVTRDSKGVVLCGCDSWECDFEEVKT